MPFVPLTPEEQERFKPPCTSREHSPPNMMVIRHPMKWVCPSCGQETVLLPSEFRCESPCRTMSQVVAEANAYEDARRADNQACDNLTLAEYDALYDNWCSICRDPNCTDPGGKH